MRHPAALIAVCLGCAAVLGAQQPTPAPPQTTFRAGVDVIQLDVSVLDKNRRPIRGLTAADFTVLENGKPQRIVTIAEMDAAERDPMPTAWMRHVARDIASNDLVDQAGDGRVFGIILDDRNTPFDAVAIQMSMRAAARYVIDSLGPSDIAAVVYVQDVGKTQDFTDDRTKLLTAIDQFEPREPEWVGPTPLGPGPGGGDMPQRFSPALARSRCQRVQPAIPTLDTVVSRLATVPQRRKTLVFLSPGVPFSFGGGQGCQSELFDLMKDVFWKAQRGNVNIYGIDAAGYRGYETYLAERMLKQGRGGGFDTQRAAQSNVQLRHDFLKIAAENTGGRAVVDTDAVEPAIDAIFEEDGSYYLVGYETSNGKPDGKFRRIQVKVNRSDVTTRARSGYWATREGAITTARENEAPTTLDLGLTGMMSPTGLPLRAAIAPVGLADASPGKREADVAVALSVRVPSPGKPTPETLTVVRNTYDEEGRPGPPTREITKLTLQPGPDDDLRYDMLTRLRLAPGRYQIRLNAHSTAVDRSGTVYGDIDVPDFAQAALTMSAIVLGARPADGSTRSDALASILPIVPTTSRDFAPGEHVTAFLRIFQGGAAPAAAVTVTAQVLDQRSAVVLDTTEKLPAESFLTGRVASYQFELPLEGRSHGPHLLTVSAKLPDGRTVRRDVVFRVR